MRDLDKLFHQEIANCEVCPEKQSSFQEWTCSNCPELKLEEIGPETWRLLEIRRLKLAQFPFQPNDLDYVSWQVLASLEEKIEMEKRKWEQELFLSKGR